MAENVGGRGWLVAVCPRKGCAGFRSVETTMMSPSVGKFHRVTCNLCNVAGPSKGTVEDAVDAWNATFAPGRVLDAPREALPFAEARGAAPVQGELTGKCAAYVDCRSCHRTRATEANGMCRGCFEVLQREAQRVGAWVPDSTPTTPSMRAEEHASDHRDLKRLRKDLLNVEGDCVKRYEQLVDDSAAALVRWKGLEGDLQKALARMQALEGSVQNAHTRVTVVEDRTQAAHNHLDTLQRETIRVVDRQNQHNDVLKDVVKRLVLAEDRLKDFHAFVPGMVRQTLDSHQRELNSLGAQSRTALAITDEVVASLRPRIVALENQLKEPATEQCVSCRVLRRWHCGHGCVKNPGHCCGEFKDMLAEASG